MFFLLLDGCQMKKKEYFNCLSLLLAVMRFTHKLLH